MASVNRVIIIGAAGRDAELRYTAEGSAICTLSLATNETWRDKISGERKEQTEWHRVVMYGRLAEIAGEYVRKGRSVYIEGRLRTRKWADKDGSDRYTTEVVAENMQLLGARDDGREPRTAAAPEATAPRTSTSTAPKAASASALVPDDLPF